LAGVSQPAILFKIEPGYSEEARKAKWQGTVSLSLVVGEFGEPLSIKLVRPLGLGLRRFRNGCSSRGGRTDSVAVYANIQVTFKLL
jgi:hypothetical protein